MIGNKILVFQLVEESYEEINIEQNVTLYSILDTDKILFFIDPNNSKVWVWEGKNTTTKMKFISARVASEIRDKVAITCSIATVDEDNEPDDFLSLIGLEKEISIN